MKEVRLDTFPVRLPLLAAEVLATPPPPPTTITTGPSVARSLAFDDGGDNLLRATHHSADDDDAPTYELSILLVPMGSVSYPTLAAGVGRPLKRRRSTGGDHSPQDVRGISLLPLEEGTGVDLSSYDHVLAVEPTGWSKKCKTQRIPPRATLLSIPYSEHSSFSELVHFVEFINPSKVVPTVSVEHYAEQESLFVEKAPKLRCRFGNTQPICNFFTAQAVRPQAAASVHEMKEEKGTVNGLHEEEKVRTKVPTSFSKSANSENKPPPLSTQRCPEKRSANGSTPTLTNCFRKAELAQKVGPDRATRVKSEKEDKAALGADDDDGDDCLYIGCGHEVMEISDDD